ncbi:hypothetical protein BH20VER1_BH20VER1_23980 [soil metagenome]
MGAEKIDFLGLEFFYQALDRFIQNAGGNYFHRSEGNVSGSPGGDFLEDLCDHFIARLGAEVALAVLADVDFLFLQVAMARAPITARGAPSP